MLLGKTIEEIFGNLPRQANEYLPNILDAAGTGTLLAGMSIEGLDPFDPIFASAAYLQGRDTISKSYEPRNIDEARMVYHGLKEAIKSKAALAIGFGLSTAVLAALGMSNLSKMIGSIAASFALSTGANTIKRRRLRRFL